MGRILKESIIEGLLFWPSFVLEFGSALRLPFFDKWWNRFDSRHF
jgi:hypothetical protein